MPTEMPEQGQDFIVSELLSELKASNVRKDDQIKRLQKVILGIVLAALIALLATVGGFLWYLNQYDFSSTTTTTNKTTQTAEGVYAIIDSEGNVVGQDLTPEEIEQLMEEINSGESNTD